MSLNDFIALVKETATEWVDDKAPQMSAALAYYTVFSIAPMLLIIVAVVGFVWGAQPNAVQGEVLAQVESFIGAEGAGMVQTMLERTSQPSSGILATVIGIAMLLFGATTAFAQLQTALNMMWEVEPKPGQGMKGFVRTRVLSFGMILLMGGLLLVSLAISTALAAVDDALLGWVPGSKGLLYLLDVAISLGALGVLFAILFRYLPDVTIAWRDVWIGAAITALLFLIGRYGLGWYLGRGTATSAYGAAGSLVVLLLWVYYSSLILFFGAEFTQVYARRHGSRIRPAAYAVHTEGAPRPDEPAAPAPPRRALPAAPPPRRPPRTRWKQIGLLALAFWIGHRWGRRDR